MLPYEERLMAYLDGEMSPADRARIDQMLEANPAARQLVDELRVLSGSLKSLPKYQLEADFYKRVLRMAEREVLTGKAPAADAVAASPLSDSEDSFATLPLSTRPRDGMLSRLSRPTVWASLTAAAALVVMIFSPDMGSLPTASTPVAEQKQVAKSTTTRSDEASAPVAPAPATAEAELLDRGTLQGATDAAERDLDKSEQSLQGVDDLAKRAKQSNEAAAATAPFAPAPVPAPAPVREALQEQNKTKNQDESRRALDGKSLEGGLRRNAAIKAAPANAGAASDVKAADAQRDQLPTSDMKDKDEATTAGINRSAGPAAVSKKGEQPGSGAAGVEKARALPPAVRQEADSVRLSAPAPTRAAAPSEFGGGQGGGGGNATQAVPPGKPNAPAPAPHAPAPKVAAPGMIAPSNGFTAQDRATQEGASKPSPGGAPTAAGPVDAREKPAEYRALPGDKAPQESQITGDPKAFKKDLATPQDQGVKEAELKSGVDKVKAGKSEGGEGKGAGAALPLSPDSNAVTAPAATAIPAPPQAPPAGPGEIRSKLTERSPKQFDGQRARGGLRWGATQQAAQPQGDVLVLTVKVPRHAWESGEFDEVLVSNSVSLDLEPSAPELVLQNQQQNQQAPRPSDDRDAQDKLNKLEQSEQTLADGENGKLTLVERPAQLAAGFTQIAQAKQEAACDMSDAVYIEATTQQVEAILSELRNRPESFLAVNCTTLPGGVSFGAAQNEALRKSVAAVEKADGRALQNATQDPGTPLPSGVIDPAKAAKRYVQVLPNQANARKIRVTRELDRLNVQVQVEAAKNVADANREAESAGAPRKDDGVKRQTVAPGQAPEKVLEMVRTQLQNQLKQVAPGKDEKQQQGLGRAAGQQLRQRVVFVFEVVDAPLAATPVAKPAPAEAAASPEVKAEPKAEK